MSGKSACGRKCHSQPMSTFSSDRVGETIIPDLTKRFRRGYIDYFDRKNGTDRPVEEIPTRSIIPLDQFEGLMKLLDDIVLFSAATPELATQIPGAVEPARSPGQGRQGPGSNVRAWGLSRSNPTSRSSSTCCAATATCCGRSTRRNGASATSSTISPSRPRTGNRVCSTPGTRVCSTRCAATGTESRTPRATPASLKATS